jgi:ribulose-5-phosphate 4-epimerase/fuculose-1-phosphate aldolase
MDRAAVVCEMLRLFYSKGWVSGTGGGICAMQDGGLLVAPTGVHKERVLPEHLFLVDAHTGDVIVAPSDTTLRPSECTSIFCAIVAARGAGSVMHSHALVAVLAADLAKDDALTIRELTAAVERALGDPRFERAQAILVRDHGAYIWGADILEAKKHAEVYHFLFEATNARRR